MTIPPSSGKTRTALCRTTICRTTICPATWRHALPLRSLGVAALLAASAAFAGCSTMDDSRDRWSQGWRAGIVEEVGSATSLERWATTDCRKNMGPIDSSARFAVVKYRLAGERMHRISPLAPDVTLAPGDEVLLKLGDCSTASVVKRDKKGL